MKKIIVLSLFMFSTLIGNTQEEAQVNSFWGYSYDIGFGLGDTRDFINKTSFLGFTIEGRKFIKPNISVGGSFSWHVFHDRVDDVEVPVDFSILFEDETTVEVNGSITGDQWRYYNSFPLLLNTHYYFSNPAKLGLSAYAGLGIGTYAIKRRVELSVLSVDDSNWHFGVAPEVGILLPLNGLYRLVANAKYNHAFSSGDRSYSYLNLKIGIVTELY